MFYSALQISDPTRYMYKKNLSSYLKKHTFLLERCIIKMLHVR